MASAGVGPPKLVKKLNDNISEVHNFMGAKPQARTKWSEGLELPKSGEIVFFAGCYGSFRKPEVARATVKVLRAAGINVAYLGDDEWCCGMIPGWSGQPEIEAAMAKHNVGALKRAGAKRVVISCAEGYRTFKQAYPKIVGKLPFEVLHTTQLLAGLIKDGKLKLSKQVKEKVTYHDPCFLSRHCRIYNEPRDVIKSIPGIEFKEMEHSGLFADCCGNGAGVTGPSFPEMENQNASKCVKNAKAVADVIATCCPRCVETLNHKASEANTKIKTIDLVELVERAL